MPYGDGRIDEYLVSCTPGFPTELYVFADTFPFVIIIKLEPRKSDVLKVFKYVGLDEHDPRTA